MARRYEQGDLITIHGTVISVHGDRITFKARGGSVCQVSTHETGDPRPSTPPPEPGGPPGGGD